MVSSAQELRDGDRRARELYHYFQPDNPALLPSEKSTGRCIDTSKSPAKASPNLVLTALAQLAAMRLGVQRAIISLIDRETLYVVAEASKSLNLDKNGLYDEDGDGLWMGCSRGPVSGTLCEKTITLRSSSEQRYPFFIVDDLKRHPDYCNIPCVAEAPHFRYYAGTPLITSNGITIGSLYVIDPRPNISLTESHRETLGTIANAVMEYMETARQSLEADRLAKVLSGLNSFVQGAVTSDTSKKTTYQSADRWDQDLSRTQSPYQTPSSTIENDSDSYFKDTGIIHPRHSASQTNSADDSDGLYAGAPRFTRPPRPPRSPRSRSSRSPRHSPSSPPSHSLDREPLSKGAPKLPSSPGSVGMSQTFQRAADTIRKSLNLGQDGGVVIFGNNARVELQSTLDMDQDPESKRKLATIWAMSDTEALPDRINGVFQPHPAAQMDLHFARRFLRRYRRGGLWHFHQDGTAFSSDEDCASSGTQPDSSDLSSAPLTMNPQSFGALREKDQQALKKYFPNAKRIMFVPLWDSFNSRWFGGCFSWSCLETRVFSAHVELGGFFGFGSSLMVEYSRIQSQESDKKKDDFISTISHELRSPLHGILAANEFLAEYVESEFAKRLLDTIRACGQTLLDTFEQILDFAKINSFASKRQRLGSSSPSARTRQGAENGASPAQPLRILKSVDVVAIIEDVIESVYSGRILSGAVPAGNSALKWSLDGTEGSHGTTESTDVGRIDVFIDAAPRDWEFLLEPGALRRVVMNVFGNALKYTQKGSISVRLEVIHAKGSGSPSEGVGSPVLLLTVSDTGKGISSQYLRSDIFTPFSQEDVLSPGTGLGLSLVRDILRSLNGDITIESQVGVGTTVKMKFPLGQPEEPKVPELPPSVVDSVPAASNLIGLVKAGLTGKALRFATARDQPSNIPTSNNMIKNYLTDWFGMKIQKTSESTAFVDLLVVDECDLDLTENFHHETSFLILCHRRPSWSTMESTKRPPNTVWLTLPCGPHQLARTLMGSVKCMRSSQPIQLDEPSPLGFTENLSELNNLLKSHTLSDQQNMGPVLASDASHFNPAPNTTTIHNRLVPKANPSSYSLTANKAGDISDKASPTESGAGIRILLVEDNAINLALLEKYLTRTKHEILHTAVNGQEAIKAVQTMTADYNYIFMVDGFEATRSIRSIERARQTKSPAKIIALTGLGSDEHIMKAYAAGVDVFLTKPISFKDILRLLDEQKGILPGHQQ
ncbi:CheY-like superfamily [Penicillium atrosanguineum]|uniref:uncharacterized protein n=1 Tax=Penicillium atrosanguineum TaxID=1132637 RepID=UPI0023898174|nr:uncharacterized protein N7443_002068 [Penicillium atrosanguineum]KAJ5139686.1 CheY-like superfamily [Penicillium atrosanguineum]KAJ5309607.1 hypothetical protein N7443_002068 [Penicillium atrosanguineum]